MKKSFIGKWGLIAILVCGFMVSTNSYSSYPFDGKVENKDVVPASRKLAIRAGSSSGVGATVDTGIAIKDGKVWVWGFRGSGQGGNGNHSDTSKPATAISSLNNIVRVAGGIYHLLALDVDGNLYGWGQSGYGETGCGSVVYPNIPCKVLSDVVYMDAGEYTSIALTKDGSVYTWGHDLYGQTGLNNGNQKTPQKLNANLSNETGRLVGAAYEGGFAITISTGGKHTVWGWGDNEAGGLGIPTTIGYGVQDIKRTPQRITALDAFADKIIYIAGGNGWGEALLEDGTVIGWGMQASLGQGQRSTAAYSHTPVVVMKDIIQLYARYVGSVALTAENEIYTWGQVRGSAFPMIYSESPTRQTPIGIPVIIGGGKEHVTYFNHKGEMYGVGYNAAGQLRPGSPSSTINWPGNNIPVQNW